eukprot:133562_1
MDSKTYQTCHMVNDIMALIICVMFCILFGYSFKKNQNVLPVMKWITISYISFYTLRYLETDIYWMIKIEYNSSSLHQMDEIIGSIGFLVAHQLFYVLMLTRLYYAFVESVFKLPQYALFLFIFGLISMVTIDSIYLFTSYKKLIFLSILVILDLILGIFLIWSFIQRLFILVVT